jgi:hypothetical protein
MVQWPPDVHPGVGHSLRGAQDRRQGRSRSSPTKSQGGGGHFILISIFLSPLFTLFPRESFPLKNSRHHSDSQSLTVRTCVPVFIPPAVSPYLFPVSPFSVAFLLPFPSFHSLVLFSPISELLILIGGGGVQNSTIPFLEYQPLLYLVKV